MGPGRSPGATPPGAVGPSQRNPGPSVVPSPDAGWRRNMQRVAHYAAMGLTIIALAAASGNSAALAQAPGAVAAAPGGPEGLAGLLRGMGSGPQLPVTVLMAPAVQKELKLTEAQK